MCNNEHQDNCRYGLQRVDETVSVCVAALKERYAACIHNQGLGKSASSPGGVALDETDSDNS